MAEIEFLPPADREYDNAYGFYRERSAKAAQSFEKAVENALKRIEADPESWPVWDDEVRYVLLKKYPYLVFYRFRDQLIQIVAIAHSHQKPEYWKERLQDH